MSTTVSKRTGIAYLHRVTSETQLLVVCKILEPSRQTLQNGRTLEAPNELVINIISSYRQLILTHRAIKLTTMRFSGKSCPSLDAFAASRPQWKCRWDSYWLPIQIYDLDYDVARFLPRWGWLRKTQHLPVAFTLGFIFKKIVVDNVHELWPIRALYGSSGVRFLLFRHYKFRTTR